MKIVFLILGINSILFAAFFMRRYLIKAVSLLSFLIGILLFERYLSLNGVYNGLLFLKLLLTNAWLFLGPSLFLFLCHFIDTKKTENRTHFIVPVLISLISICYSLFAPLISTLQFQFYMVTCVYTIQILYYSYISIRTLNKSSKKVSQLQKLLLFTLMTVLIVDLTALPLTYLISFNYRLYLDIYFVLISALSYLLIGLFIEEPTLFRISQFIENRHQKSNLVLVDIEKKLDELNRIMYSEKMYLNPDLSAGELSARLQISKQQLSELLNKHMKKRFVDYLNQFRLETAVNLLEKSDPSEPIAQIAYQSGFNSIATFYRYFDHHYQCTPTDFRKNILVDRLR